MMALSPDLRAGYVSGATANHSLPPISDLLRANIPRLGRMSRHSAPDLDSSSGDVCYPTWSSPWVVVDAREHI